MPTIYHAQIPLETYYLMYLILLFNKFEIVFEQKSPLTSYPPNGGCFNLFFLDNSQKALI